MKSGKSERKPGTTRRDFLKGAAVSAAGVAALGVMGGCSSSGSGGSEAAAQASPEATSDDFEIINTDFLVLGVGNQGTAVALQAISEGKHVTVIDKGPFRHGGSSGMSWDAFSSMTNPAEAKDMTPQMVHGPAWKNAWSFLQTVIGPGKDNCSYMVSNGQYLPDREEDGSVAVYSGTYCQSQFFRREMDYLGEMKNVSVYDNTMITDLLINDGRCLGAMGIHLPTGKFRVFRAPATVIATGGANWVFGWATVSAYSIGSADATADVDMACYRHGMGIAECEWAKYDLSSATPVGLTCALGCGIGADPEQALGIIDKDGKHIFEEGDPDILNRIYFNRTIAQAINDGRGSENGGVFVSIGDKHMRYAQERKIDFLRKYFDIDPRTESLEEVSDMYEHGGTAVIDENLMTEVEGLFHSRGAGCYGIRLEASATLNRIYGIYAAHSAVEYIKKADPVDVVDWAPAIEEYNRLHEIRTRKVENGIRPWKVLKNIRVAAWKSGGIVRTTENLEATITELERIRAEEIPAMIITSESQTFNREWKEAIEAYNLLDYAEMTARASLFREETRSTYLRPEFPEQDDDWTCMVVVRNANDTMQLEKQTLPPLQ